jgi:hypothetical protein
MAAPSGSAEVGGRSGPDPPDIDQRVWNCPGNSGLIEWFLALRAVTMRGVRQAIYTGQTTAEWRDGKRGH